jgi:hypothetical protein
MFIAFSVFIITSEDASLLSKPSSRVLCGPILIFGTGKVAQQVAVYGELEGEAKLSPGTSTLNMPLERSTLYYWYYPCRSFHFSLVTTRRQ